MDPNLLILTMIVTCLIFIFLIVFSKPLRLILRVLFGFLWGGVLLVLCGAMGLPIGFNLFNLAFVGLLGLPGLFGLVALGFFL